MQNSVCYLYRYRWIRKAFTVVLNQVSPRFLKLFKPSLDVEFQAAPTTQNKAQLTCGR